MVDKPSTRVFAAPPFLVAIAILAVNDHVLKTAWPGPVTGILSDIVGLFAFGFLAAAACGRRSLVGVTAVALGFVVWKTAVGLPLIQWWNTTIPWRISRVADPSDFLALAAIPLGAWAWKRARPVRAGRVAQGLAGTTAAIVVVATSVPPNRLDFKDTPLQYTIRRPPETVALIAERYGFVPGVGTDSSVRTRWPREFYLVFTLVPSDLPGDSNVEVEAVLTVLDSSAARLTVRRFETRDPRGRSAAKIVDQFERQLLDSLRFAAVRPPRH